MKLSKVFVRVLAFICFFALSSSIYASDFVTTEPKVKTEIIKQDDKKIEIIVSEDKYVRITQPTKVNTSTFESKMNIMGETSQGTEIIIEVYNTKLDKENTAQDKENTALDKEKIAQDKENTAQDKENTAQDKDNISLPKNPKIYKLKTVGITETFNQLIELLEGENKVVLTYTNEKDKKNKEKMSFYIIRESEKTKESVKKADSVLKVFETIQ